MIKLFVKVKFSPKDMQRYLDLKSKASISAVKNRETIFRGKRAARRVFVFLGAISG